MTAYRVFPLVAVLVAVSFTAAAQFGGPPGSPPDGRGFGGSPGSVPDSGPPPARPPQCQALLAVRSELQKHGEAIGAANHKKADVRVACRLFKSYIATEAKMITMLDEDGASCGVPPQVRRQVRDSHARAQQIGQQVCDAAARGPGPGLPNLLGPSLEHPSRREKLWPLGDYWLPHDRLPGR
jgi:hypothetical protein